MLKLESVSKEFYSKEGKARIALRDINGEFFLGDVIAVIGENGSGKSTLLNIIATFLKPSSGNVLFDGHDVFKNLKEYRGMISYVSEKGAFIPELSASENLEYFRKLFEAKTNIIEISERVGIKELLKSKPENLSKGQRQRLSLAISMLKNSKIILLDEPAEGLDIETKEVVKSIMREYKESDKLVFYVTHDEDEIEEVCNKIIVLRAGEEGFVGTKEEFWQRYEKFYKVVYEVDGKRKVEVMSLDELNKRKSEIKILHLRNLRLREIINFIENMKEDETS
ncbi:MAG: ABC transporter ATP-binding protein [Fervidobacterium sp.]|jgi:ABC-type multidrug transport system ATPase subunit